MTNFLLVVFSPFLGLLVGKPLAMFCFFVMLAAQADVTYTIQSTASMRDRSLVGSPMASKMMAMVMMPPAGIPAAPTLEAVAVTLEIMIQYSLICVKTPLHFTCRGKKESG